MYTIEWERPIPVDQLSIICIDGCGMRTNRDLVPVSLLILGVDERVSACANAEIKLMFELITALDCGKIWPER